LRRERLDGGWCEADLLRPRSWLGGAGVGCWVPVNLPEMGAHGLFRVLSVEPCPRVEPRPGEGFGLVTGTFRHGACRVLNVWLAGERDAIGVTGLHPFWSADRGGWVPAGSLQEGESVQGLDGPVRVQRVEERGDEPVYNLEVDADHCYRVGEQGILVHNVSVYLSIDPKWYGGYDAIFNKDEGVECYCGGTTKTIPKREIPAPNSGWTKPAGLKIDLPTEGKIGNWQGTVGDSDFVVFATDAASVGLTANDRTVPYRRGEPYFDKWAVEWYEVPGLDGSGKDFNLVGLAVAMRHMKCGKSGKETATAGKQYLSSHTPQLTPHHAYDCYVAIIPTALNSGLSHTGTAAILRAGSAKC
jgi:hypothetical protein